MTISLFLLVFIIVFLASLTRSVFGFGDSVVAMPLLALLPISLSISISLIGLMGLMVATFSLLSGLKQLEKQPLLTLTVSTLVGIPIGLLVVKIVSQATITYGLGIFLVVYGLYSLIKQRFHLELPKRWRNSQLVSIPFGFLAGVLGSAYNMNGIPIVVYGTFTDMDLETFQGTLQAHFFISSLFVILGHFLGGLWSIDLLFFFVATLPAIFLASYLGKKIRRAIPVRKFEYLLFAFIILLGSILLSSVP